MPLQQKERDGQQIFQKQESGAERQSLLIQWNLQPSERSQ